MTTNPLICIAVCAGAFGVRGEVKIKSFTDTPKDCFAYGPLRGEDGKVFLNITSHRAVKNGFAAFCQQIDSREQAQALAGSKLYVYRADMPAPAEGEFYHEDLIGLEVKTTDGRRMGKIIQVHNFGAGDMLEIKQEAKRGKPTTGKDKSAKSISEFYHPFTKRAVPKVDIKAGRVVIFMEEAASEQNED